MAAAIVWSASLSADLSVPAIEIVNLVWSASSISQTPGGPLAIIKAGRNFMSRSPMVVSDDSFVAM
jgi:hypothetical protein